MLSKIIRLYELYILCWDAIKTVSYILQANSIIMAYDDDDEESKVTNEAHSGKFSQNKKKKIHCILAI